MAQNKDNVGSSGAIKDNSKDVAALEMMKKLEKKLNRKLVTAKLPDGCIITTTKKRMKELLIDHGYSDFHYP